jgi:hypothetical protein
MIDLAIDTSVGGTWDCYFVDTPDGGRQFATVQDEDEVAQRVAVATRTALGEYAYDTSQGLPWSEEILIRAPNLPRITDRFRALWISIDGVTEIFSLVLTPNYSLRQMTVAGSINTIYGPASFTFTL